MSIMADTQRRFGSPYSLGYSFALETVGARIHITCTIASSLLPTAWLLNLVECVLSTYDSKSIAYLSAASAARKGGTGMMFADVV